jgi:hypothetical protein
MIKIQGEIKWFVFFSNIKIVIAKSTLPLPYPPYPNNNSSTFFPFLIKLAGLDQERWDADGMGFLGDGWDTLTDFVHKRVMNLLIFNSEI